MFHAVSQGQLWGRCRVIRRAEVAIRHGIWIRVRRTVAVVADQRGAVRVAAARVRLNAITASTSQAAFAVNTPDGRCARAEFFRSAWTCSMIACRRWVLSAVTVSSTGSVVVKNAWNRQTSNSPSCPVAVGVEVGDPAHDQPARHLVGSWFGRRTR